MSKTPWDTAFGRLGRAEYWAGREDWARKRDARVTCHPSPSFSLIRLGGGVSLQRSPAHPFFPLPANLVWRYMLLLRNGVPSTPYLLITPAVLWDFHLGLLVLGDPSAPLHAHLYTDEIRRSPLEREDRNT